MKKLLILASAWLLLQPAFSQNTIAFQFKVSKPYCIVNFLETAAHRHGISSTLEQFITEKTKGNNEFAKLISDYDQVKLDYSFRREEFPQSRRPSRTTFDFIAISLVSSSTISEFRNKMLGILPNSELQKLTEIMQRAEIHYDRIIWKDYEAKLNQQKIALEKYTAQCSESFTKINHFYNSFWISDIPFTVALYPIPGDSGSSAANPYSNSLCVGVLTDEKDYIGRIGVVLHEMCHVLYDEQSSGFQHKLEGYFNESKSPYKQFAYNFIDEGLATALGNGWAYNYLSGKPDPADWYNNEYINGFGKALYPLVSEYLAANKQIDQEFVNRAIDLFGTTFPNSITDYGILLNRVSIYGDSDTDGGIGEMMDLIGHYFHLTHIGFSSPLLDSHSLESLETNSQTQLVIIDRNQEAAFQAMKKIFPELSKVKFESNKIYAFFDKKKRPIILLNVSDQLNLDLLLKEMQEKKYFDRTNIIQN